MGIGDGGRVLQFEDGRVGTIASRTWPFAPSWGWRRGGEPRLTKWLAAADCWVRVAAMAGIVALFAVHHALPVLEPDAAGLQEEAGGSAKPVPAPNERFFAFYISQPFYDRSDVHFVRSDETDVVFKQMGWDGDALMPPIDGGVRVVKWRQNFGFMIDFLHNKAVSRLGKGAHGREISNPVIETVEATGRIAGAPAPPKVKLTDFFERFEFTHGHNVLIATPLVRFAEIVKGVRPYAGIGAGVALPHVEVWYPGQDRDGRTNEYQFAGPAGQFVAGLEYRRGGASYFVEYKYSFAWIRGTLTGDQSWKNFNLPGDLLRQFRRWWTGEGTVSGHFETTLSAHQTAVGGGFWWPRPTTPPR